MNSFHFIKFDKRLQIKVIAGVVLLVMALIFYLLKEQTAEKDLTISQIPEISTESFQDTTDPMIMQTTAKAITIIIDVSGAVMNPSVVKLSDGSRVYEAIEMAGGLSHDADTKFLNQAEILIDGQKVYIPTKQEIETESNINSSLITAANGNANKTGIININTASSELLQQLSGIGPATAEKIISYRNEHGKFNRIEDIKNVSGIGEKTFEKFKDKITV
ncbi:MAG: helix-hairpin-helix domain-containing protein [Eubacteriales bacterium]|nr:helix-hairpin-helix domain-containing protein [Eubacteriales bacterium]MDD3199558.1 helix-hairpin-helix domain-containing protein [Eubacteriales bacterium]MDD4122097.1 helix-hairpin-helix domain-containing protein [Eubacteriales bacterium]MDD4629835.1 helix-hairpin-helix domain-containing protein [Eubacteriales bacterium]